MSFDTQVAEISSSDLDKLFDASPDSTPTADNLAIGKELEEVDPSKLIISDDNIPEYIEDEEIEEEIDLEGKTPEEIKTIEDAKIAAAEEAEKEKSEDPEKDKEQLTQVNGVLKNTVEYLVSQGLWADFEGREDLEINQESYAELASRQAQHSAYEMVNELIDSTGDYGKAIISHIKAGGNPDEIIDLFKEQKASQQIDTSTEQGKQSKIEKYYKDIVGRKPEWVEKHIKRVIEDNEIDSEFEEIETLYDKHYKEELSKTQEKEQARIERAKEKQNTFVTNIKSALDEDTSLTLADRKLISSSILDFKHKLEGGQKVNDFYIKFAEMQADPKQYIELVRYVMDNENYKKQIKQKENTNASKEIFNFIKGNSAITKTKSNNIEINENKNKGSNTTKGTNFSFLIKK